MVTYFNKKDLVKFGNYLLSENRESKIIEHLIEDKNVSQEYFDSESEKRFRVVHDADIENFLETIKKVD